MLSEDLDNLDDDTSAGINPDTARYLKHIESKLYDDIQSRKRIDNCLLFLACQVGSSSLAWLLFTLQISISLIMAVSMVCALLPGLIDAGESFNFELSSERWSVSHNKPLIALGKLLIGGVINWHSTSQILRDNWATEDAIKATYTEIREAQSTKFFNINQQDFILPSTGILTGIILAIALNRRFKNVP